MKEKILLPTEIKEVIKQKQEVDKQLAFLDAKSNYLNSVLEKKQFELALPPFCYEVNNRGDILVYNKALLSEGEIQEIYTNNTKNSFEIIRKMIADENIKKIIKK